MHLGLLHRASEKLAEYRVWSKVIYFFDRLDYVSIFSQEEVFIGNLEQVFMIEYYRSFGVYRILFNELTRVLNHLLAFSCHLADLGAVSPLLWCFEDRERIFEMFERFTGIRMHVGTGRLDCFNRNDFYMISLDCIWVLKNLSNKFTESLLMLTLRILLARLIDVGVYDLFEAVLFAFSGPLLRSVGLAWDLRLDCVVYFMLTVKVIFAIIGDSYDRLVLRVLECAEAIRISFTCLVLLIGNSNILKTSCRLTAEHKWILFTSMESLLFSFLQQLRIINGCCLQLSMNVFEVPKGEMCNFIMMISVLLFRCRIRSCGFVNLAVIGFLVNGLLLSDLVVLIGTIDVVFGEVDR